MWAGRHARIVWFRAKVVSNKKLYHFSVDLLNKSRENYFFCRKVSCVPVSVFVCRKLSYFFLSAGKKMNSMYCTYNIFSNFIGCYKNSIFSSTSWNNSNDCKIKMLWDVRNAMKVMLIVWLDSYTKIYYKILVPKPSHLLCSNFQTDDSKWCAICMCTLAFVFIYMNKLIYLFRCGMPINV